MTSASTQSACVEAGYWADHLSQDPPPVMETLSEVFSTRSWRGEGLFRSEKVNKLQAVFGQYWISDPPQPLFRFDLKLHWVKIISNLLLNLKEGKFRRISTWIPNCALLKESHYQLFIYFTQNCNHNNWKLTALIWALNSKHYRSALNPEALYLAILWVLYLIPHVSSRPIRVDKGVTF